MAWPSVTTLLESKLHWMARKLRKMDEPSDIIEWTPAMEGVLRIYNNYLKDSALSSPRPKHNWVSNFKGSSILVNPANESITVKTQLGKPKKQSAKGSTPVTISRVKKKTKRKTMSIPEHTWVSNEQMETDRKHQWNIDATKSAKSKGRTEKWSSKWKGIMDAKKEAVLKMLDPKLVHPPRVQVGSDEIMSTSKKPQDEFKRLVLTALNTEKRTPGEKDEVDGGVQEDDKGGLKGRIEREWEELREMETIEVNKFGN